MLTVGVSGNSKTCYVIPDDPEKYGELVGTRAGNVPEVCRRIAEELGVEVEFVEYATLEAQLQAVTDGDVDLAAVEPKASYITPVPGGVGPMTRAMLMRNILTAAEAHLK